MHKGVLIGKGRTAEVFAWGDRQVLKLFFTTWPVDWIQQEARVARVVHEAGLAAPATEGVIEVEGRLGIVYERIEGRSMLEEMARRPWRFFSLVRQFADLHLEMHRTVATGLPGARELLARLLRDSAHLDEETGRWLLERLEALPDADTVCHGDFHPDNILISPRGPVVIDWMSVTRGHPLADVAGTFLLLSVVEIPDSVGRLLRGLLEMLRHLLLFLYLRRYFERSPYQREEMHRWVPVMAGAYLGQGMTGTEEARLIPMIDAARGSPPPRT